MFTTPVHIPPSAEVISLDTPVLSIGSCFAQVIGQQLVANKFTTLSNPFGTLYNPAALFRLLHETSVGQFPSEETYLQQHQLYFNYKFHSDISAASLQGLQQTVEQTVKNTQDFLKNARWLIITLGTAFSYELTANQLIVSNCHKQPARLFHRRMLDVEEIAGRFDQMHKAIDGFNHNLRYIFTVSPVRHTRDTLEQNSVSKASLRVAVSQIQRKYPDRVHYFPSYEIMMDELRDYRFYRADMIHPSEVAENYIWDKFVQTYMDAPTRQWLEEWRHLQKALQHKAFHPQSEAHQRFLQKTIEQLKQLSSKIDVTQEIHQLEAQLA